MRCCRRILILYLSVWLHWVLHLNFLLWLDADDDEIELVLFDFCLDHCDSPPFAADNSGCESDGWWLLLVIAEVLIGE